MSLPVISIIMPAYNAAPFLREAVDSILNQTFDDFEFIIIDDGSTDDTTGVMSAYDDPRIIFVQNPQNMGIVGTLNRGLEMAQGEFIARMDADDISLPTRFEHQIAFMRQHPEVGMLATNDITVNLQGKPVEGGRARRIGIPSGNYLRWRLIWTNPISHPTVIIRHELMRKHDFHYDPSLQHAEDWDLWARIAKVTELYCFPQGYLFRRINPQGVTKTQKGDQIDKVYRILSRELDYYLPDEVSESSKQVLFQLFRESRGIGWQESFSEQDVKEASGVLVKLYRLFRKDTATTFEKDRILYETAKIAMQIGRGSGHWKPALQTLAQLPTLPLAKVLVTQPAAAIKRRLIPT